MSSSIQTAELASIAYRRGYLDRMQQESTGEYRGQDFGLGSPAKRAYDAGWDHAREDILKSFEDAFKAA